MKTHYLESENFGPLRYVLHKEIPLFFAVDIAKPLGFRDAHTMLKRVDTSIYTSRKLEGKSHPALLMTREAIPVVAEKAMNRYKTRPSLDIIHELFDLAEVHWPDQIFSKHLPSQPAEEPVDDAPVPAPEGFKLFESEEFGQVRVVQGGDGEPWFVAKDVAKVLGYANTRKAIIDHCKGATDGVTIRDSMGREQKPSIIPERDVYRLIIRSRLPEAERFEEWVVGEILPSIRKHGAYATENTIEQAIDDPDTWIKVMEKLKAEKLARKSAEIEREEAIETKHWISHKKAATAMGKLGGLTRAYNELKSKYDALKNKQSLRPTAYDQDEFEKTYKQVRAIPWLHSYFVPHRDMYVRAGKELTALSYNIGLPPVSVECSRYGKVNAYHIDVIEVFRRQLKRLPDLMRKYRVEYRYTQEMMGPR